MRPCGFCRNCHDEYSELGWSLGHIAFIAKHCSCECPYKPNLLLDQNAFCVDYAR